ncbi:SMI1/KNR4 family protein [Sporosarcina sp. FSL W8-0480]|uniref:SMI1/KNR4 family protein n=1 Tax=Sporosarcina sp. FSL W8-0480 TaxID=2954701 RepID=UPI0030DC3A51
MQHILLSETMNKPATDEEIKNVEQTLGRKLPSDFLQLLKIANGGIVKDTYQAFPVDFSIESGDQFIVIEEIMGANEEGLMMSNYFIKEWDLPEELVLFSGSGHAWVGFNYKNREFPSVVYVEPDDGNGNNFHVIADTFTEFVSKLTAAE